jgi:hypothetical protein
MSDLVKKSDLEFVVQLNNFKTKLPGYMALFGISQATVDAVVDDANYFSFMVTSLKPSKDYSKGWTQQKNDARLGTGDLPITGFPTPVNVSTPPTAVTPGVEQRFRNLVKNIKSNANYTDAIGQDLGIVATQPDPVLTAPVLKLAMEGGNPTLRYTRGISNGLRIYCKRASESTFSFLDVSTRSPYTDTRPNVVPNVAETRQYYAYFIMDDEQVGTQSATVSISVA